MEFGIHVKTYDQVTERVGNVTKPKWVPGGEIVIGPHVRMGRGKYGRVSALRYIVKNVTLSFTLLLTLCKIWLLERHFLPLCSPKIPGKRVKWK